MKASTKCISYLLLCLLSFLGYSQDLTISSSGQVGSSGANWTTSGTNPVVISSTGTAVINTSVIEGYLNSGQNVLVQSSDDIVISNTISWTTASSLKFDAVRYINISNDITNTIGNVEFIGRIGIRSAYGSGTVDITISGGGDITFTAPDVAFDGAIDSPKSSTTTINSTGHLTIQPYGLNFNSNTLRGADGGTGTTLEWEGIVTSGTWRNDNTSGDDHGSFRNLTIQNYSQLGGLTLNKAGSTTPVFILSSITVAGPITIDGSAITVNHDVITTTASNIKLSATIGFSSGTTTRRNITSANGNILIEADADANGSGTLDIDYVTFNAGSGDLTLRSELFQWIATTDTTKPWINGTGAFILEPNDASFGQSLATAFFTIDQDSNGYSELRIGKEGYTENVTINTLITVAGPISVFGGNINANMNLRSTVSGSDIVLKATKNIVIGENVAVHSNNGDITIWSNSDGVANATEGDFIGIYSGVSINSANGLTNQTTGGGTITLAGGTTTQTLASGTVVPTDYALSTRTTNWVDPLLPPGGVNFGEKRSAVGGLNTVNIYSGGGDIVVKGKSNSSSAGVQWFSGSTGATQVINSGTGTVTIDGLSTSSTAHGIEFMSYASVVHPTIISSNTSSAAISIKGETSSTNNRAGYQGTVILTANGIGGGIEVHGKVAGSSNYGSIEAGGLYAYALTGPITFIGEGGTGLRIGGTWGKGTLPSSNSNIIVRSDKISFYPATTETTGTVTVEPLGTSFASALTFPITNLTVSNTVTGLTLGKSTNTQNITFGSATTISGPITAYGGNIAVNENLNTTAGGVNGDILLKASGDISLAASKAITTGGGDVILWSNSDNAASNGSVALRNLSSITTGSNAVPGGAVWIGGGSDGATWNGLPVGSGYAVPGTSFTPSNGGSALSAGIYLEGSSINSFGGPVKLAADASSFYGGLITYATNSIDAKSGKIELEGIASNTSATSATGVLFGIHDVSIASAMNLTSSAPDVAITISGVGRGTGDAVGVSGTLNCLSTGTGEISITGNASGTGRSIVAGNFYSGIINAFAASGKITLNGGTKAVQVAVQQSAGQTTGPSKINLGKGASILNSSSDVVITADNIAVAASGIAVNSTGKVTVAPSSNSFASALTFPITNLTVSNTVTGLTLGKSTNTQNITFGGATTIAGPINAYGGNIGINAALTATNADVSLFASGAVTQTAPITANGLSLNGTGTYTLTNTSNNITTIAGGSTTSKLGRLSFTDASAGLTIGTIGQAGINATGDVLIETLSGDILLTEPIITTSNTNTLTGYAGAIVLNAGKSTAIGTVGGGDIKVSGNGAIFATNGITKLYSGRDSNSTGLTTLVGGTANTRAGVDETTATFSPVLTSGGSFALYRAAVGTGNLTIVASGGDAENSTWEYTNGILTTIGNTANVNAADVVAKLALGDLSLEANQITFSANIANTTANAFNVRSKTHIINTNATTITSQGGDVLFASNVDDATDGESTVNGYIRLIGLTITTNGGDIILGGENSNGTGYALGTSNSSYTEGIRIDATTNLNTGGGNISIKGKSYNTTVTQNFGASGVGFYFLTSPGNINSGTGTILIDGYSQTAGALANANAGILFWNNNANTFTIQSSNTTAGAITLNGYATGATGQAYGIETEVPNTLNIFATGVGGGITVNTGNSSSGYDLVLRGETNILAQSGPIQIKGGQFGATAIGILYFGVSPYFGSKAASSITSSQSDITFSHDQLSWGEQDPYFATTGLVTIEPANTSFIHTEVKTEWFQFNQNNQVMSGLVLGKSGNTKNIAINTPITVAGPISIYGGTITVTGNLTSTADGDIFIKGITGGINSVFINGSTITKSAGTGTLTMQANGRVNNSGTITASGSGRLNVVLWSDFNNTNDAGASNLGSIASNGGHVWMGGSSTNGGSLVWNGLAVGDGPSVGSVSGNFNAMDFYGDISTNGGDILAWAGNGVSGDGQGVTTDNNGMSLNLGSGNATFISDGIFSAGGGNITLTSTGKLTLAPNDGAYPGTMVWSHNNVPSALNLGGYLDYLLINNSTSLGGLTIGEYNGTGLVGDSNFNISNTSDITITNPINSAGEVRLSGRTINTNANITTTALNSGINLIASGDIIQAANTTSQSNNGDIIFWADRDNNGGQIALRDNVMINTANGSTASGLATGGKIILAGGLDNGANDGVANDGIPDGIALGLGGPGIIFGQNTTNTTQLFSGGGAIIVRGKSTFSTGDSNSIIYQSGIYHFGRLIANSGKGSITFDGESNRFYGINFVVPVSNVTTGATHLSLISDKASGTAISIKGTSALSHGVVFNYNNPKEILATGGGDISITGAGAGVGYGIFLQNQDILASAGSITLNGGSKGIYTANAGMNLGRKVGSAITSSSAEIRFIADTFSFVNTSNLNTSGKVTLASNADSFASALTFPVTNLTLSNDVSGLTLGKATNTQNITFGGATTIAGPITAFGGTITLNANLTTTNSGNISLYTDNALGGLTTARTVSASGAFGYIPRGTAFTTDVTFPITNLTVTCSGLTIGNLTNDKNITINQDISGPAGISLYGANLAINSNLVTTNTGDFYLKGVTTIAAGKHIQSSGNFTHNGDITFKSNATGTAVFGALGGTFTRINGEINVERYIPAKRAFRFLSSSVTTTSAIRANWQENGSTTPNLGTHITGVNGASSGFDATTTNNPSLFTYNGSWQAVTNTNTNVLTAGTGYRLMVRGDRTLSLATNTPTPTVTTLRATGSLLTGNFSPILNQTADGYSFLGNPYQAPVDIKAVIAASTNLQNGFMYYWDPTLNTRGGYVTRNLTANTNDVGSTFNDFLQQGQAVFVKKDNTANVATLTFTESNKSVVNASAGLFKSNTTTNPSWLKVQLKSNLENQLQELDATMAVFAGNYSWDVNQDDAVKMSNLDEQVSFRLANQNIAIASQSIPTTSDVLPINLTNCRQSEYQWQFDLQNYNGSTPYLLDTQNQSYTEIQNGANYTFTVDNQNAASYVDRFKVVFSNTALGNNHFANTINLYPNPAKKGNSSFTIEGLSGATKISMHNLLGQRIAIATQVQSNGLQVRATENLPTGIYLINITTEMGSTQVKWIVE